VSRKSMLKSLVGIGLAGVFWIILFAGYPEIFLLGLCCALLYAWRRYPSYFAPGIRCSRFKLDLSRIDGMERIFRVGIAVLLPINIALRTADFVITIDLLSKSWKEAGFSALIVERWGIGGLALNFLVLIGALIWGTWFLYGVALRYRMRKERAGRAVYVIFEIVAVGGLLLSAVLAMLIVFRKV